MDGPTCSKKEIACYSPVSSEGVCDEEKELSFFNPLVNTEKACNPTLSEFNSNLCFGIPESAKQNRVTIFSNVCGPYPLIRPDSIFKKQDQLNDFFSRKDKPEFEIIARNLDFVNQFFNRCGFDLNEIFAKEGKFKPLPYPLFEIARGKLNRLFDLFPPEEIKVLFERITNEEELDKIIQSKPVIDELRDFYLQLLKSEGLNSIEGEEGKQWYAILSDFPIYLLLGAHQDKVLELIRNYHDYLLRIYSSKKNGEKRDFFYKFITAFSLNEISSQTQLANTLNLQPELFFNFINSLPQNYYFIHLPRIVHSALQMANTNKPNEFQSYLAAARVIKRNARFASCDSTNFYCSPFVFSGLGDRTPELLAAVMEVLTQREGRELILNYQDNFLKLLEVTSIWVEDNTVPLRIINLEEFLKLIPRNLFHRQPLALIEIARKNPIHRTLDLFDSLNRLSNFGMLSLFVEYSDTASIDTLSLLDYFSLIQYPKPKLTSLLKRKTFITLDDLVFDYRTGKDLRYLDLSEQEAYVALMAALPKMGWDEKTFSRNINLSSLSLNSKNLIEKMKLAREVGGIIDPFVKREIYQLISDWIYDHRYEDFSSLLSFGYDSEKKRLKITENNLREINALLDFLSHPLTPNFGKLHHGLSLFFPETNWKTFSQIVQKVAEKIDNPLLNALFYIIDPTFGSPINILREYFPDLHKVDHSLFLEKFAEKIDVEEMDLSKVKGYKTLAEALELQRNLEKLRNQRASSVIKEKLSTLDRVRIGEANQHELLNIVAMEAVRRNMSYMNNNLRDQLVDDLAKSFLTSQPNDLSSIPLTLQFARAWGYPNLNLISKDTKGIYEQYSFFAYGKIAPLLKPGLENSGNDEKTRKEFINQFEKLTGLKFKEVVDELEARGFSLRSPTNFQKGISQLLSNPSYVIGKTINKLQGNQPIRYDSSTLSIAPSSWVPRKGVEVQRIMHKGKEVAVVIKFKRDQTGVKIFTSNNTPLSITNVFQELGSHYIFSSPLAMFSKEQNMTELAFKEGEQVNWTLNPHSIDGLLLVHRNGEAKILDKQRIKLGDLLEEADLSNPVIQKICQKWLQDKNSPESCSSETLRYDFYPFRDIGDKILFLESLKAKKYSLLSGMLFSKLHRPFPTTNDWNDWRRFFVEFEDGTYGVINSSTEVTIQEMMVISEFTGFEKAIYMDTGVANKAIYYKDGSGKNYDLGKDTAESNNRVVIYSK